MQDRRYEAAVKLHMLCRIWSYLSSIAKVPVAAAASSCAVASTPLAAAGLLCLEDLQQRSCLTSNYPCKQLTCAAAVHLLSLSGALAVAAHDANYSCICTRMPLCLSVLQAA
jgi:hypothetical protein